MNEFKHFTLTTLKALVLASLPVCSWAQSSGSGGVTLYGSMIDSYGSYWNYQPFICKFKSNDVNTFSTVKSGIRVYGGGTYANGTYYAINYSEQGTTITLPTLLTLYDTKQQWDSIAGYRGYSCEDIAADLTYDPVSAKVYGVFYNASYDNCNRFCSIELDNPQKGLYSTHLIATLPERMVAIASNKQGKIYTVGKSGKLYAIDKNSGEATVVGNTGVQGITTFFQSACFSMTNGKMY